MTSADKPASAESGGSPAADFDDMLETYYRAWFRYHPEAAVEAGVDGYAHLLTPYDDDDIGALLTLHEELMGGVDELDNDALDADRRINSSLVYGAALLEIEEMVETDWRRRDPGRYLPVNAIYQLTVRPVADFPQALVARLAAIPEYLRGARQFLREVPERIPSVWLECAVAEARTGADYLRSLVHHPKVIQAERQLRRLDGLLSDAVNALLGYAEFLESELAGSAHGDFACGKERFEHLLHYRHFLDVDTDALRTFGQELFDQTRRELVDACGALGAADVPAAIAMIQRKHPHPDALLNVYREQMEAAHGFVVAHDLVTAPGTQRLDVVETPIFMRHQIPFAAYMEPAPNDPEQRGYYYVTPAGSESALREHNFAGLMHTCVHEAWPGHHLQFVTANASAGSRTMARFLNPSSTLYEGWALYCEQLMHEQGFLDLPEQRFILLKDRLWRALRVIIDVDIHTGGASLDAAAARMVELLGFDPDQAEADVTWYSYAPTTPMGYATGWALINAARDRVRLTEGEAFTLRGFHDQLLEAGSIALPLVMRRQFDDDLWLTARTMVFGRGSPS